MFCCSPPCTDHVAQHGADGKEPLSGCAHVVQPNIIQQDLLHDEGSDRLGELAPDLHGPQAQRDDLRGEEEVDHIGVINLEAWPY